MLLQHSRTNPRINRFHRQNLNLNHSICWSKASNRFIESTNTRSGDKSSTNLGTKKHKKNLHSLRSLIQCLFRNVWSNGDLFGELKTRHGIICGKHENLGASQLVFKQVFPSALVQVILYSLHSDHSSANLRKTETLQNVHIRF